jgi:hypothetical protein
VFRKIILLFAIALYLQTSAAEEYSYASISKRYAEVELDSKAVKRAKMEGECLVGLKNLNYRKKEDFDAVAEWTSYRSFSLLEQYSPCNVLIIMEVAQAKLKNDKDK